MSQHLDIKTSMKYVVLELDLELPEHQKQHEITLSGIRLGITSSLENLKLELCLNHWSEVWPWSDGFAVA